MTGLEALFASSVNWRHHSIVTNLSSNPNDAFERISAWMHSASQFILEKAPFIKTFAEKLHVPPLVVGITTGVLILVILRLIFGRSKKTHLLDRKSLSDLDVSRYNDDIFFGVRWRWQCERTFSIDQIKRTAHPLCPHCGRRLNMVAKETTANSAARVLLVCPVHEMVKEFPEFSPESLLHQIAAEIELRIRDGSWRLKTRQL